MYCYYCGADFSGGDVCPVCGEDVRIWKKVYIISNRLYNEGLEKAQVRDLSGAAESLRLSLRYNKKNVPARNLLGLVFYEMGDSVQALSEWVISKSEGVEDNPAADYIAQVQKNASQLSNVNSSIRKYNMSLSYCRDGNYDLALIQMKKVASTNPKFVKGQQLLALLYMQMDRHDLAMRHLRAAEKVDANNTMTLRYMQECREYLRANGKLKTKKEDAVTYQSENDIIIRPAKITDNTAVRTVINLLMGVAIGVAFICFLVIPEMRQRANTAASADVVAADQTLAARDQNIENLSDQVDLLSRQIEEATSASESAGEVSEAYQDLLKAFAYYENDEYEEAEAIFDDVDRALLNVEDREIYDSLKETLEDDALERAFNTAMDSYDSREYQDAIDLLLPIVEEYPEYNEGQAAYYLGFAYNYLNEYSEAVEWLTTAMDSLTDNKLISAADKLIDSLADEGYSTADDENAADAEADTAGEEEQ
ncbi:MAG: hypothetical protein LUC41_07905 [Clostridiales bacterium]|nr:hypothetical protein [Clostridiales bacterium]